MALAMYIVLGSVPLSSLFVNVPLEREPKRQAIDPKQTQKINCLTSLAIINAENRLVVTLRWPESHQDARATKTKRYKHGKCKCKWKGKEGRKEAGKQVTQEPVQSIPGFDRAMWCCVYKHTHAHASGLKKIIIKRAVEVAIDNDGQRSYCELEYSIFHIPDNIT